MKSRLIRSVLTLILCASLLPLSAPARGEEAADTEQAPKAVTRSDLALTLALHPEGFPQSTSRLRDWAAFLQKLRLEGYIHTMDFLDPYSRVYMNGSLLVNGKSRVPFVYDGYYSYRYIVSPALKNRNLHFQMHNFFEFMLKPYHFMELHTQYLAFLLYPEAARYIGESYYLPVAEALAGRGSRTISYPELYELAETLNLIVIDDPHYLRGEFFFTSLLLETGMAEATLEKLGDLVYLLDYLDPEQEGMTITVAGNQETYVLGETTVFQKKQVGDAVSWTLRLPDPEGYLLECAYQWTPSAEGAALTGRLSLSLEEEELFTLSVGGLGLPCQGDMDGRGRVTVALGGTAFPEGVTQMFDFRWSIDQPRQPFRLELEIDWLHPQTAKAALTLRYEADMRQVKESVFRDGSYKKEDFFSLNDSSLEAYKERYLPSLSLALFPVVIEMPPGVVNDLMDYFSRTGLLSFFGL